MADKVDILSEETGQAILAELKKRESEETAQSEKIQLGRIVTALQNIIANNPEELNTPKKIADAIVAEVERAEKAERENSDAISSEVTRAKKAEKELTDNSKIHFFSDDDGIGIDYGD